MSDDFDLAASRLYWRFAPSGRGKHDTSRLLRLNDIELEAEWDDAFESRLRQYPEEREFLRTIAVEFAGKRVLSVGSGLGFHEIYYQLRGARVTCSDIVPSNLSVIQRMATIKAAAGIRVRTIEGPNQEFGGPFDIAFVYGSLMTVPERLQRDLLARCRAALAPGGRIVLMLYTWEFASATCGWNSPRDFDPKVFARASDPSVSDEHCPWSDWHDDAKILSLADDMQISRRQLWNQGWFVWYELIPLAARKRGDLFFDPKKLAAGPIREVVDLSHFVAAAARLNFSETAVEVETEANNFSYAIVGGPFHRNAGTVQPNAILVEVTLIEGGFSVGLLDEASDGFASSHAVWQHGLQTHVFVLGRVPERFKIILSNHRPGIAASSRFLLHRVELFEQAPLSAA